MYAIKFHVDSMQKFKLRWFSWSGMLWHVLRLKLSIVLDFIFWNCYKLEIPPKVLVLVKGFTFCYLLTFFRSSFNNVPIRGGTYFHNCSEPDTLWMLAIGHWILGISIYVSIVLPSYSYSGMYLITINIGRA